MSTALWTITVASWCALTGLCVVAAYRKGLLSRAAVYLLPPILIAAVILAVFGLPFQEQVARSSSNGVSGYAILALFIAMVVGMICHSLYSFWTLPESNRPKFRWQQVVKPILVSPIVFIPLVGAFQSADLDLGQLTAPRLMIFMVAFENGFFWKQFFERRKEKASEEELASRLVPSEGPPDND